MGIFDFVVNSIKRIDEHNLQMRINILEGMIRLGIIKESPLVREIINFLRREKDGE